MRPYVSSAAKQFAPGNFIISDRRIGVTRAIEDAQEANPRVLVKWMDDLSQDWVRSEYLYLAEDSSVHRATEPASAPIGQGTSYDASSFNIMDPCGLTKRIATLEAALEECLEYFKDKYDVVDGSYGEPSPNKEMQLGSVITEALYGPGVV